MIEAIEKINRLTGFAVSAGVVVESVEPGNVVLSIVKKTELTQFNGYFHGGVIAGLADHAAGAAATSVLPRGRIAVTVDMHVNFLASAAGEKIEAMASVELAGRSIVVVSVRVTDLQHDITSAIATVTLRSVAAPESDENIAM